MAFLNETDLHTAIYPHLLKAIKQQDETIVVFGIDAALEEAESHLKERYNTEEIFNKEGDERNKLLLMMCRDIAIFNIIGISNPGVDYEDKSNRAETARKWFDAVRAGEISPNLPKRPAEENTYGKITYGSNRKRRQHY